jgi:hypothetical protein
VEGRRAGKSQSGGHELAVEALATYPFANELLAAGMRREFWVVGPEYTDSEKEFRVLWDDLKRLEVPFDRGSYNLPDSGSMAVSLWGGAFIVHAKSAKYPGTLVGESLDGVIMAEAAKLKRIVWTKFIRPMLADTLGWSLFLTTPEGRNWLYDLYLLGQDPKVTAWASWRFASWINTAVFKRGATDAGIKMLKAAQANREPLTPELIRTSGVDEEIVAMLEEMSPELFAQEVEAKFTEYVGRVFKAFDETFHVRPVAYNPGLPVHIAVDYGWTNPFVVLLLQTDKWGNTYVLDEHYETERDTQEVADDLWARWPLLRKARMLYPDPAEPDRTHVLTKTWKVRAASDTGGELKTRLELIRRSLKPSPAGSYPVTSRGETIPGAPALLIADHCVNLIREMNDYRYPETKEESNRNPPDEPLDKDNHGPEALGRYFRGYFGKIARHATTVRTSPVEKATATRGGREDIAAFRRRLEREAAVQSGRRLLR